VTWARLDDLRAGTAIRCPQPDGVLVAERPDEVVGVLAEVERATESGRRGTHSVVIARRRTRSS
jgi:para-aminobenzoate synthetase/4-amino-4-deoxychorismate lyase